MTLHSVLIEIVLSGARGIERESLIERYGRGVMFQVEHLMQLRLVLHSELPYWMNSRYFASKERGGYPRLRMDAA
jgi:hypothetical protein